MKIHSEKWDLRFLDMAKLIASWSKDPSTKVGAVIVDHNRVAIGLGYNGFPRHVADSLERIQDRPTKLKFTVHAELNAILNATRSVRGCTLYSTFCPCANCAAMIVQSGIDHVVYTSNPGDSTWAGEQKLALTMFAEAGIKCEVYDA